LRLVSSGSGDTGVCLSGDNDAVRGPSDEERLLGFLRRLLGGGQQPDRPSAWSPEQRPAWMRDGMEVQLYEGREDLEVVGEASYQDNLWRIIRDRRSPNGRVREEVYTVLAAEPENPYDANAVAVWIQGLKVGYLSREDARRYRPGLQALEQKHGKPIALAGVIARDSIRVAFMAKWGRVPVLELYRQMAIRQQKAKNFEQALWWVERGIAVYGIDCARAEAVEDLQKRATSYRAKLNPQPRPPRPRAGRANQSEVEVLTCSNCGREFQRTRLRGRKPLHCPECRDQTA
jgi:HIRAN domain-containing protein